MRHGLAEYTRQQKVGSKQRLRISDGVGFHGNTVEALRDAFQEAVEDYGETCAKIGKEPQRQSEVK